MLELQIAGNMRSASARTVGVSDPMESGEDKTRKL
jgi:hypothetical protein